mmetsp:Transcript_38277/g.62059  ORF Transcript_38277/g.62059 Transcript_38277/m.62059 type:complete len:259 (+) Transcript_38277:14-790(+)
MGWYLGSRCMGSRCRVVGAGRQQGCGGDKRCWRVVFGKRGRCAILSVFMMLEGTMDTASPSLTSMTLDEPVSETIKRDLRVIGTKIKCVLIPTSDPTESANDLRNWDLWGPLLLCLVLSIVLSFSSSSEGSTVFATIFVIVWCGSLVLSINTQLLGGKISIFQSVCVLGYCIFPLVVSAILVFIYSHVVWKAIVVGLGFLWSSKTSFHFMGPLVPENKKLLVVYPVFLFYSVIAWIIFINSHSSTTNVTQPPTTKVTP